MENTITISLEKYEEFKNGYLERLEKLEKLDENFSYRSAVTKIIHLYGGCSYHISNDQTILNKMITDQFIVNTTVKEFKRLKKEANKR